MTAAAAVADTRMICSEVRDMTAFDRMGMAVWLGTVPLLGIVQDHAKEQAYAASKETARWHRVHLGAIAPIFVLLFSLHKL